MIGGGASTEVGRRVIGGLREATGGRDLSGFGGSGATGSFVLTGSVACL